VVGIEADTRYIDPETGKFSLDKARPIVYSHGEYYTLGELIGHFGWSVKRKSTKRKKLQNLIINTVTLLIALNLDNLTLTDVIGH
jgi:hypothetical protein